MCNPSEPEPVTKTEKIEYIATHYTKAMHTAANSILNDYHEAEDAVQEAILRLYNVVETLEDPRTARTRAYCVMTAKNTAVMLARKRAKQIPCEEIPETPYKDETINTSTVEAEEMLEDIDRLPEKYQNIIRLRCFEERSAEETAELMDLSVNTVNTRLLRARAMLRNKWVSIACLSCGICILAAVIYMNTIEPVEIYNAPAYSEDSPIPEMIMEQDTGMDQETAIGPTAGINQDTAMDTETAGIQEKVPEQRAEQLPASGKQLSESRLYEELDQKALEMVEGAGTENITGRELIEEAESGFVYKITIEYEGKLHVVTLNLNGELISHEIL